ncbi:MAG: acyl carrier protein [Lachnospiraceae bacterium]|nr:acyl carrier protein [Lachnospiraceae bacterium]
MEIERKVKDIIASVLNVNITEIEDDTAIGDLPEWDSLHHIQIISAIEKAFDFRFTPDVMMDLEDVSDIVNATEARVGK